jgi:sterol desaturase/sphingolipid hydroxylase (fatty acid hydroxylase superfamily)
MNSPNDASEPGLAGWTPDLPLSVPPLLKWPPNPVKILAYLFGFPGLYFPWIAVDAAIALAVWEILQATHTDLAHLQFEWIAMLVGLNLLIACGFYGAWHHYLYGRRAQGIRFKYNARWPAAQDRSFLFGRPATSNVFWSLASGVPIWSAYLVLTLWAQARGITPLTSWVRSPLYCTSLVLILPFFHALHFYVGHRLIHWAPIYNTVHYLHHRNVNPSPWSGLAMHPLEHVVYFSGALLLWVIPSTPFHVIYFTTLVALAPCPGHCGFGKLVIGQTNFDTDNYYHYLHHKFFKVNFGDNLLIPLDKLFGTFHDGIRRGR